MKGSTHQIFGVTCYLFSPFTTGHIWLDMIFVAIGALIPDIDHPKSIIGRLAQPISLIIYQFAGHRGPFHSLMMVGIMGYLLHLCNYHLCQILPVIPTNLWGMIVFGFMSHLIGDSLFGSSGVPIFWPLKYRLRLLPISLSVGGASEFVFNSFLCLLCLFKSGDVYFQSLIG